MFRSQSVNSSRCNFFPHGLSLRFTLMLAGALLIFAGNSSVAQASTLTVTTCSELQSKINAANFGDVININASLDCSGPQLITLPYKGAGTGTDSDYITIQTSVVASLPAGRVGLADLVNMPKLQTVNYTGLSYGGSVIKTEPKTHHWRLIGIEITADPTAGLLDQNLITLGEDSTAQDTLDEVPHHITIDRCYIHVGPSHAAKRGIALNSASTNILNSYIAGFKLVGTDSQAICMWNGPGPFQIINNYLEAAGENILIVASNSIPGMYPSDVEIRHNTITKPLSWRPSDPSYAGTPWSIKNLIELKTGKRVTIDGNIIEYCWDGGQDGAAVLFQALLNGGLSIPQLEDITFTNNIVRHASAGILMDGKWEAGDASYLRRVTVRNNLFTDIDGSWGSQYGRLFVVNDHSDYVTIEHNTAFNGTLNGAGAVVSQASGNTEFVSRNNIFHNDISSGLAPGDATMSAYFSGAVVWTKNVQIAGQSGYYAAHPGNYFPATAAAVGFVDYANGNYRLAATSPYKGQATDGKDIGLDVDALNAAQNGVVTENVVWRNPVNVNYNGNNLTRAVSTSVWDGGASSTKAIASGDGSVEFTASENNTYRMCGLSNGDANQGYTEIDYAIYLLNTGVVYVYENGLWRGSHGTYVAGDHFYIEVKNGKVQYRKNNGAPFLIENSPLPTYPLLVDTSLYTPNSTISNVVISGNLVQRANGAENVTWANISSNVQATGNSLKRIATTSVWDGGASSTRAIASGDGYVEFTAGENNTYRMCGLSNGDANQGYTEIDYAIYLLNTGVVYVYENGLWRGSHGTYVAGDVFRVAVEGGRVRYRKNGALFSVDDTTPLPTYPLLVDTSLYTPNATINNAVISGTLTP